MITGALRTEGRTWAGIGGTCLRFWLLLLELLDGKSDLALLINSQYLDLDLIFFCEEVMDIFYINICNFRNVDETGLAFRQFDERTKIRDAGYDTLDHTANFNGQINSSSLLY